MNFTSIWVKDLMQSSTIMMQWVYKLVWKTEVKEFETLESRKGLRVCFGALKINAK